MAESEAGGRACGCVGAGRACPMVALQLMNGFAHFSEALYPCRRANERPSRSIATQLLLKPVAIRTMKSVRFLKPGKLAFGAGWIAVASFKTGDEFFLALNVSSPLFNIVVGLL